MKLTKQQLKQIIKEELEAVLEYNTAGETGDENELSALQQRLDRKRRLKKYYDDREEDIGSAELKAKAARDQRSKEYLDDLKGKAMRQRQDVRSQARAAQKASDEAHQAMVDKILAATGRFAGDEDMKNRLNQASLNLNPPIVDPENPTPREIRRVFKQAGIPLKGMANKIKGFFGFEE